MILQFCGLSGAGKTTLARAVEADLKSKGIEVEILDGDDYRTTLCTGLGFSKKDRMENVRRMAFVAQQLSKHGVVSIICAINPYEEMRNEIAATYAGVKTIFIDCAIETLAMRDTKGLYRKAILPDNHPDKIKNLTGINDPFERPEQPDVYINTGTETVDGAAKKIITFIMAHVKRPPLYMYVEQFAQYAALRS